MLIPVLISNTSHEIIDWEVRINISKINTISETSIRIEEKFS